MSALHQQRANPWIVTHSYLVSETEPQQKVRINNKWHFYPFCGVISHGRWGRKLELLTLLLSHKRSIKTEYKSFHLSNPIFKTYYKCETRYHPRIYISLVLEFYCCWSKLHSKLYSYYSFQSTPHVILLLLTLLHRKNYMRLIWKFHGYDKNSFQQDWVVL